MINSKSKLASIFWKNGKVKDCPVIDFHAHMGELAGGFIPKKSPEEMINLMNKANIALTCFCSHDSLFLPTLKHNKEIYTVSKYPDRFKAYLGVTSRYLNPQEDINLIKENQEIFIGFKFLCDYYQIPLTDKRHKPYFEYADEKELLILSHTWSNSKFNGISQVKKVLNQYPNLIFLAGHSFKNDWEKAAELAQKYSNLYLELTAVLHERGVIEYFVKKVGSDRLLFGVDLPWFDYFHGIGAILSAEISDKDRRNILYLNGKKILKRFSWVNDVFQD